MSKTRGLVFEGFSPRTPLGAVAPADALPDLSRYGNDGVFTDITWVQLPSGLWVMTFNGSTSVVNCGTDISLDWQGSTTMLAWTNLNSWAAPSIKTIMCKAIGGDSGYMYVDGGNLHVGYRGGIPVGKTHSTGMELNTWNLVGYIFDRENNLLIASVNAISESIGTGGEIPESNPTEKVAIGAEPENGTYAYYMPGFMSSLRIWHYALSPDQINSHYAAERTLFGV